MRRGLDRGVNFGFMGPQFSRGFDALKVWVSLLAHGRTAYARRIEHDASSTRYLGALVEEHPDFELMCEPRLSICCFRYRPAGGGADEEELDRLNQRLMTALQSDGRVYCSNAVIGGRFGLRACIVNFRTEAEDVDRLLAVAADWSPGSGGAQSSTLPSDARSSRPERDRVAEPIRPPAAAAHERRPEGVQLEVVAR